MVRHAGRHIEHDLEVVLRANRTALLSLLWAGLLACVVGSLVFDIAIGSAPGERSAVRDMRRAGD